MEVQEIQELEETGENQGILSETFEDTIVNGKIRVEVNQTEGFVRSNFANNQNIHLNNSIRFADTKAGALVAVNGLIAKFVFDAAAQQNQIIKIELMAGFLFLIIGIALSVLVVFPRKVSSKEKGIIYWENINEMNLDEYIDAIEEMDAKQLRKHSLKNNYIQAKIITKKFDLLRFAFISSLLGYSILAFVAMIVFFLNIN